MVRADLLAFFFVALVCSVSALEEKHPTHVEPHALTGVRPTSKEGGQIKVYNLSDGVVLARTNIAGVLYATLALEAGKTGYLNCEYAWYEVEFFSANTNIAICRTGTPVNVYCGNTVVLEGSATSGNYTC